MSFFPAKLRLFLKKIYLFIYLFERERERAGRRDRGRGRISSRLPTECVVQHGTQSHDPEIMI